MSTQPQGSPSTREALGRASARSAGSPGTGPNANGAGRGRADGAGRVTSLRPRRLVEERANSGLLDEATVEAARRGDRQAWEDAYLVFGRPLMGFLVLRLGDADDAGEALSETFLRGLEKASSFRGDALSFRAWLYRIARNVATDRMRARGRVHPVAEHDEREDTTLAAPDEAMISSEDAAEARAALACLPADDRELIWLRVCAGLSADEVGKIVGKRPGAVRMQQMRSLEAMAARIRR